VLLAAPLWSRLTDPATRHVCRGPSIARIVAALR
jgi:hypothetical protein